MSANRSPVSALVAGANSYGNGTVRDVLQRAGVTRIEEVGRGADVLAVLSRDPPDLLVLDWAAADGAASEIVSRARAASSRVVVTMAEPTRSAVEAAKALAVDAVVAAPFAPGVLLGRLRPLVPASLPRATP